jgi:hypothetical protein
LIRAHVAPRFVGMICTYACLMVGLIEMVHWRHLTDHILLRAFAKRTLYKVQNS